MPKLTHAISSLDELEPGSSLILAWRLCLGWTQSEAAEDLGMTRKNYLAHERVVSWAGRWNSDAREGEPKVEFVTGIIEPDRRMLLACNALLNGFDIIEFGENLMSREQAARILQIDENEVTLLGAWRAGLGCSEEEVAYAFDVDLRSYAFAEKGYRPEHRGGEIIKISKRWLLACSALQQGLSPLDWPDLKKYLKAKRKKSS